MMFWIKNREAFAARKQRRKRNERNSSNSGRPLHANRRRLKITTRSPLWFCTPFFQFISRHRSSHIITLSIITTHFFQLFANAKLYRTKGCILNTDNFAELLVLRFSKNVPVHKIFDRITGLKTDYKNWIFFPSGGELLAMAYKCRRAIITRSGNR